MTRELESVVEVEVLSDTETVVSASSSLRCVSHDDDVVAYWPAELSSDRNARH